MNNQITPTKSRRSRRYLRITREGWSYIFILCFIIVGSVLQQINLLVMLAGLMIAPLLFNWRIAMNSIFQLQLKRAVPNWAHAGQTVLVEWEVKNLRSMLPAWGVKITDSIRRNDVAERRATSVDAIIAQINPNQTGFAAFRCHFGQRGIYYFEETKVSSKFPLGLVLAWYHERQPISFVVAPRLGTLTEQWRRKIESAAVGMRSTVRRVGTSHDEFFGLRPWRSGDSRRAIHWRSTAKQGELIVKQFDQHTDRDFAIVLDLWQSDQSTPADMETAELAVSFAATVIAGVRQKVKGNIAIGLCGQESTIHISRVTHEFTRVVLTELADIQAASQNNLGVVLEAVGRSSSGNAPLIVISTRSRAAYLAELESAGELADSHSWAEVLQADWVAVNTTEFDELFTLQTKTIDTEPGPLTPARFDSLLPGSLN